MAAIAQKNIVAPGVGERARFGGMEATFKVAAGQTGGAFSMVEFVVQPGALVPPHVHENKNEVSFVTGASSGSCSAARTPSLPPEQP
jgi:quercetin dioxygenase-like cupin family protein